ncbi:hypothetical protein AWW68_13630 [Roseivirga spongicola]|uniref:Uroporphyrinogen decarboxylase n=1 Tax=Roseivirga spongicola TaxID=333140 RepID=A0A150X4U0_9BACT|nr:hypothetical protein AWW68_13630 [Roseivirga spongicola]
MIHIIGYSALGINLLSMTMKNILMLRVLSLIANMIYIAYGILLNAPPFIIGCGIAVLIHGFHIIKIQKSKKAAANNVYKQ